MATESRLQDLGEWNSSSMRSGDFDGLGHTGRIHGFAREGDDDGDWDKDGNPLRGQDMHRTFTKRDSENCDTAASKNVDDGTSNEKNLQIHHNNLQLRYLSAF